MSRSAALESKATGLPAWERGQTGQVGNGAALTVATSAGVRLVTHATRIRAARFDVGTAMKATAVALIPLVVVASVVLTDARAADTGEQNLPASGDWNFRVTLDGKPIGEHRFTLRGTGYERELVSAASFTVRFFGFTAYRYRHHAVERWQGDCLDTLDAETDDDGKPERVRLRRQGGSATIDTNDGSRVVEGCVMSFAYWTPAIRDQTRLLNAQTGVLESVRVQPLGSGTVDVHGRPVAATSFRISGMSQPIDVWYSTDGAWVGLDSIVRGGHKLSYRLP